MNDYFSPLLQVVIWAVVVGGAARIISRFIPLHYLQKLIFVIAFGWLLYVNTVWLDRLFFISSGIALLFTLLTIVAASIFSYLALCVSEWRLLRFREIPRFLFWQM